jgi:L-ascorbate metabolism protein UlaG (beta-lactamase superfamily)
MSPLVITLVGGPTALVEFGGFRLLTDPTFDGPGEYQLPHVTLKKIARPALTADEVGAIDAVLLSHDQHADNLDRSGRAYLARAARVLTTVSGAQRIGGRAQGLAPWGQAELSKPSGERMR